ncbi:DUF992 domain-containing protein [Microbaculum marinisediminis]|uniref:DUF992 domain-containing protein n=1 Tax=Microbaculum marinisediminis TaxID=2931392 RepID=A0AAW5R901_9HYPH|nr:DUF992 domain-containing protein [Microbaculum sp. A6E488]MCT8974855.1 DUF992 domain-containing protein [Microbaculum sp. A6E488]
MRRVAAVAAAAALTAVLTGPAAAQDRVEAGVLKCDVAGGTGFIVGSTKNLTCQFERAGGGVETYSGVVRKFGLDIGTTGETVIVWGVLGPASGVAPGALAGGYGGLSAEATVGVGVGANALIGGSNKAIVLQPLSVQAQEGLNIAAGMSSIELTFVQ